MFPVEREVEVDEAGKVPKPKFKTHSTKTERKETFFESIYQSRLFRAVFNEKGRK